MKDSEMEKKMTLQSQIILASTALLTIAFILLNFFIEEVNQFKKEYGLYILYFFAVINLIVLFYEWRMTNREKFKFYFFFGLFILASGTIFYVVL